MKLLVLVGHVRVRQVGAGLHRHLGAGILLLARPVAHAFDRLFHEAHVGVESHRMGEAGLVLAQQVAGAANLEVPERDLVPASQFGMVLQHLQPPLGLDGNRLRHDQVAVRAPVPPADTPADLVQLGEAEAIGPSHDERVGICHVQAVLDDRRADQDVGVPVHEAGHCPLEGRGSHLAVSHVDGRAGEEPAHPLGGRVDGFDPVVQEEDLPPPVELALAGLGDQMVTPRDQVGHDRHPVPGRGPDQRQIPDPREREVERTGNGRGGQREHIHRRAQALQPFLLADAEALLLVDDHEAQVVEGDVAGQESVGADDDVRRPLPQPGQDVTLARRGVEARE